MQIEPIAIYFEIPATDPMGREHVEGKLRGLDDEVVLHWKIRDRTFNREPNPMHEIHLEYHEVEDVEFHKKFWGKRFIDFKVGDPKKLEGMPGIHIGKATLHVTKKSKDDAERLAKFLDYKISEHRVAKSQEALSELFDDDTEI